MSFKEMSVDKCSGPDCVCHERKKTVRGGLVMGPITIDGIQTFNSYAVQMVNPGDTPPKLPSELFFELEQKRRR